MTICIVEKVDELVEKVRSLGIKTCRADVESILVNVPSWRLEDLLACPETKLRDWFEKGLKVIEGQRAELLRRLAELGILPTHESIATIRYHDLLSLTGTKLKEAGERLVAHGYRFR